MTKFYKLLILIFSFSFLPMNARAANEQSSTQQQAEQQIDNSYIERISGTRKVLSSFEWPDIQISVSNKNENLVEYCKRVAIPYNKSVIKMYKLYGMQEYFNRACDVEKYLVSNHALKTLPEKTIETFVLGLHDLQLAQLIMIPFFKKVQRQDEIENSYRKTPLAWLGVDYKNSFIVNQLILLTLFFMSLLQFLLYSKK